jgi:hypothetical protein
MAWVKTIEGFSKPYYFNVPELWFVSDPEIVSGQRLRLFGRNLAPGDGRTNGDRYNYAVAFRHTGSGTIYWGQVLDSTTQDRADFKPYHLQVKVPGNLAAGDYEVRVHALYGGAAGWSNSLAVRAVTGRDFVGVMSRPADHSLVTPAGNGKPPAVFEVPGLHGDGAAARQPGDLKNDSRAPARSPGGQRQSGYATGGFAVPPDDWRTPDPCRQAVSIAARREGRCRRLHALHQERYSDGVAR